jgi:hypothetical protein
VQQRRTRAPRHAEEEVVARHQQPEEGQVREPGEQGDEHGGPGLMTDPIDIVPSCRDGTR